MNFLLYLAIAATAQDHAKGNLVSGFNHMAEKLLLETAFLFKVVIEGAALLILALAVIKAIKELVLRNKRMDREEKLSQVRLDLGVALCLSLEFLLAADIAATAVSPSWDAVGKLAAISAIRTFLNYFLEKEVKALEREQRNKWLERETSEI